MTNNFDYKKFIGREFELKQFETLLEFKTPARMLTVRDTGGNGKSQFLEKLRHQCRTGKPRIPVSLIVLDQLKDTSPLFVVKTIVEQIQTSFNIKFNTYTTFESARVAANYSLFTSTVNLQGAEFEGASNFAVGANVFQGAEKVNVLGGAMTLTPDQEEIAQTKVITSFFEDLQKHTLEKPVVMIFDSYDKCDPKLQTWLVDNFLASCLFNDNIDPGHLLVVIGGREMPRCDLQWSPEKCEAIIHSIDGFRKWTKENVKQCLEANGFDYSAQDIDYFYTYVEKGVTTLNLIQAMQALLKKK